MTKSRFSEQFWISNISNMNVSLTDLGLTIPAHKTVNLLDKRHYSFSKDELILSATSGSLFKKNSKLKVRKVPPIIERRQIIEVDFNAVVPSRRRSIVQIENIRYEELDLSDDLFAEQSADLTDENYPPK
jgi:hypothetical protein